ncbi:ankyrin-1-like isoform X2 [Phymastichus coffea]|uniref:ankyrin-1-like isoform X2 n=1 Tax=Phymastichus coffea TaxID=108790 RepID=UPI00273AEA23|nr:ankyrin-1-like isoform X2 [Phymastichus coffea]
MSFIKKQKKVFNDNFKNLIRQGKNAEVLTLVNHLIPRDLIDDSGCYINARTSCQITPLMAALLHNRFELATVLLECGADFSTSDSTGKSATQIIFNRKRKAPKELVLQTLKQIKKSSITRAVNELLRADYPLEFVVNLNDAEITREILQRRVSINSRESYEALKSAMRSLCWDNIGVLLHYGPAAQDRRDLFIAELSYNMKGPKPNLGFVNQFIERLIYWNVIDYELLTLFHAIFENGTVSVVEMFLNNNIDIYVKDRFNLNLLIYVCGNPNPDVIKLLHKRPVNINALNSENITGLHLAVRKNLIKNVQYLLDMGADPDIPNGQNITPLFDACSMTVKNPEIINLLLHYDANVQLVDQNGHTLIQILADSFVVQESIFAHLAKLSAQGEIIREVVIKEIDSCDRFQNLYSLCCWQIDQTRNWLVAKNLSVFTVLVTRAKDTITSLRQKNIVTALLNFGSKQQLHWYYISIIKRKLERSTELTDLHRKVARIVAECSELFEYNYDAVEKIMSFLTYQDLIRFV